MTKHPNTDGEAHLLTSLVQSLSERQRQDVLKTSLSSRFFDLLGAHQARTLADLVAALQQDPYWPLLQQVSVGDLITLDHEAPGASAPAPSPASNGHAPRDSTAAEAKPAPQLDLLPSTPGPAGKGGKRGRASKRGAGSSSDVGDLREQIATLLSGTPGLRTEEIAQNLGQDTAAVKSAVGAMRAEGQLRTEGQARGTRNFLVE